MEKNKCNGGKIHPRKRKTPKVGSTKRRQSKIGKIIVDFNDSIHYINTKENILTQMDKKKQKLSKITEKIQKY